MATFLLVHGAWHGRWCFRRLVSALERRGHAAVSIDLPGHGDGRDPATVTFDDYTAALRAAIASADEPPILVGHSMGGMVVSAVADEAPDTVAGVSYIAAYVPNAGDSILTLSARAPMAQVAHGVRPSPDMTFADIDPVVAREVFYHDCSDADAEFATSQLCRQPGQPMLTPVALSGEGFASVPKSYILCEKDAVISPSLQAEMAARCDTVPVTRLFSGHSPFLSMPDEVAESLKAFAHATRAIRRARAA